MQLVTIVIFFGLMTITSAEFQCDSITRLSGKDKKIITDTFNIIKQEGLENTGSQIFATLFTRFPQYKQFFNKLWEVPTENLQANPDFQNQVKTTINGLDSLILELAQPINFAHDAYEMGYIHGRNAKYVHPDTFKALYSVMFELFTKIFESKGLFQNPAQSQEIQRAWSKLFNFVTRKMISGAVFAHKLPGAAGYSHQQTVHAVNN